MTERDRALRVIGEGKYVQLVSENGWEYASRPNVTGIVVIVAVTNDGKLVLVEQPRVAVHSRVIELPAGMVGDIDADEALVDAARRELIEETGFDAGEMTLLADGPIAVGISDEVITFYKAGRLARVGPGGGDEHEDITVHEVPLTQLRSFMAAQKAAGRMVDPKIFAGLFLAGVEVPR